MISRRSFLRAAGASAGLATVGGAGTLSALAAPAKPPAPTKFPTGPQLGIEHVVILMMENRSFDHLLGWLPHADGTHSGLYEASNGKLYRPYPLAPDYQGCGYSDADHSWEGFLVEYNHGRCDGFLKRPGAFSSSSHAAANTFPVGYYTKKDLPVLAALAQNYTTLDRYFAAIAAETYPNRFYQHAARTDRDHNSTTTSSLPTIWDQLSPTPGAGKPTGAYYFQDLPFLALWGEKHAQFVRPYSSATPIPQNGVFDGTSLPTITVPTNARPFLDDVRNGDLPNVSFVDPSFLDEGAGTSDDDHPLADVRLGDKVIANVYHALSDAGMLDSTILVINFDEWGGFYDHVPPPRVVDDTNPKNVDHSGNTVTQGRAYPDYRQLGFRVPCIMVSPFGKPAVVGAGPHGEPYEHTSALAMIHSLFGTHPLAARDQHAYNLLHSLDLHHRRAGNPSVLVPTADQIGGPGLGWQAACGTPFSTHSTSPSPVRH